MLLHSLQKKISVKIVRDHENTKKTQHISYFIRLFPEVYLQ